MGAGIAQLGAQSGARTLLFDLDADGAASAALASARAGIAKLVEKGRLDGDAAEIGARLETVRRCDDLGRLRADHRGRARAPGAQARALRRSCRAIAPDAVLASNTSSIPITAIATAAADPSKVVGMHFFNPRAADEARRGHRRRPVLRRSRSRSRAPPARRWASASSTPPTAPASSSTAATGRSAWRRCACCPTRSPTSRRSTASCAPPASAWGRSSCRTSSASTSASRSRSRSTS